MGILSIILILVCAVIAWFMWKQAKAVQSAEIRQLPHKRYAPDELRIENAGPGAVIRLTSIGPDLEDFDAKVLAKHVYRSGESSWYELECDRGADRKVWIDMEEDDELELAISLRELKLVDLGLKKADLERMDDEEEGEFTFENVTYRYEDSDQAVFYRFGEDKNAERFYYWDFESKDGKKFIGIESWSDGSVDVFLSEAVKASQVTVYSLQ